MWCTYSLNKLTQIFGTCHKHLKKHKYNYTQSVKLLPTTSAWNPKEKHCDKPSNACSASDHCIYRKHKSHKGQDSQRKKGY